MNAHGSLSIENDRAHWSKAFSDGYPSVVAIGILSGIAAAFARTPIHLPGHKAIFWMAPVLATRLLTRTGAGASVGALTAALTALSLGGRIAGGIAMMPLVILAGFVLDAGVQIGRRYKFGRWAQMILLASAGAIGNLICFVKRLSDPIGAFFSTGNLKDMLAAAGSHLLFGFLAGVLGAAAAFALIKLPPQTPTRPD
jgi:hypothetical protein